MSGRAIALMTAAALIALPVSGLADPAAHTGSDPAPLPVPSQFPQGSAYPALSGADMPSYSYRQVLADPRLISLIEAALAHNQDVAVALANIAAARAQYRIQAAARFPELDASFGTAQNASPTLPGQSYSADASVPSYEIDLFGRIRSLTNAARAKYLSSEAAARTARLMLVADVSNAWLSYAADSSLLAVAQNTARNAQASVDLTRQRVTGGIAPLSDQLKAELTLHTAEADIASQKTAVAQDLNALRLLAGTDVAEAELAPSISNAAKSLALVPAGISSAVLLQRPDIAEAELNLVAANAEISAARAALFPKITLSGVLGFATTAFTSLFTGGAFAWTGSALASYPIFRAGAGRQNVKLTQAQRDATLATYRKAIQSAFADVANVLARRGTIEEQLTATTAARDAAAANYRLTDQRYKGGVDSYLDNLTAQQSLYAAEKTLVAVQLARATNLVGLYRALGGDRPGEEVAAK